ncbi:hypothetical protein KL920_004121 [Ogataea angusta]|nr:hypothetical protein KL920_004121 [Ogataea angusta]
MPQVGSISGYQERSSASEPVQSTVGDLAAIGQYSCVMAWKYVPHSGSIEVQSDRWIIEMRYCKQQCGTSITQTQGEWEMHRDIVQQQSPEIVQVLSSQCTSKISVIDSGNPWDLVQGLRCQY